MTDTATTTAETSPSQDHGKIIRIKAPPRGAPRDAIKDYVSRAAGATVQALSKHGEAHIRYAGERGSWIAARVCIAAKSIAGAQGVDVWFYPHYITIDRTTGADIENPSSDKGANEMTGGCWVAVGTVVKPTSA